MHPAMLHRGKKICFSAVLLCLLLSLGMPVLAAGTSRLELYVPEEYTPEEDTAENEQKQETDTDQETAHGSETPVTGDFMDGFPPALLCAAGISGALSMMIVRKTRRRAET